MKAKVSLAIGAVFLVSAIASYIFLGHDHSGHDHSGHGHAEEKAHDDHGKKEEDHSGHDHSAHDHSGHGHAEEKAHDDHGKKEEDHSGHDHGEKRDEHAGHDHDDGEEDGHDGHDHGAVKAIGEGKAIVEVDEKKGMMLSKEAIDSLEITFTPVMGQSITLAKKAVVSVKSKNGVYRFRDGFFKLIEVSPVEVDSKSVRVTSKQLKRGDKVVVTGLGPLRVADVFSTDTSEYGHSH